MAFTKITDADLTNKGVRGLPDTPNLSTSDMQAKFDEIATDVLVPKHNSLIDELEEGTAAASVGAKDGLGLDSDIQTELDARYTKTEVDTLLDTKVDKEEGKGLSSNDYTDYEKEKLSGIEEEANKYELPTASADVIGGIRVDNETITVDENGVAHAFGEGGTSDYEGLLNKPQINGVTLMGGLTTADLGINDGGIWTEPITCQVGDTEVVFTDLVYDNDATYDDPFFDDGTGTKIPFDSITADSNGKVKVTLSKPLENITQVKLHFWS